MSIKPGIQGKFKFVENADSICDLYQNPDVSRVQGAGIRMYSPFNHSFGLILVG